MSLVKVGIIDVGSNTVRLLAAESGRSGVVTALREERRQVGLGDVIERRGRIPGAKLSETADTARGYAKLARRLGCEQLEVVVTAPGRQSTNSGELLAALRAAVGVAPRVLSAETEGRLAYMGAVASADALPALTAVCDVGGGSTEIAFGVAAVDADWVDSIDTGSLRLTSRFFADSAGAAEVRAARAEVRALLAELEQPRPQAALATGGSARALRRIVGRTLGSAELEQAVDSMTGRAPAKIARKHGIELRRARTLLAGAVILSEVNAKLGVPFEVARGGMREGLAAQVLAQVAAA
jgi:exopolyphosphatase / guanosine-5'-triphosphate,3'-diphosphate pyrophosphatase